MLEKAACKGQPLSRFFPKKNERILAIQTIKEFCSNCPVRVECLKLLEKREYIEGDHGIYGGTTPRQRRILKAKFPSKTCLCETGIRCYVHS